MGMLSEDVRNKIERVILDFMDDVINRRIKEPFDIEDFSLKSPFQAALVPEEIWKASKFERSFVTSLGMIGWEKIAKFIAEEHYGFAENNYRVTGRIFQEQLRTIQKILDELEHKRAGVKRIPDWGMETKEIDECQKGQVTEAGVVSDLFVKSKEGETFYFEIKSSKPNSDQTKVSKEKMLKIYAMKKEETPSLYFALPDNPWIEKEKYAHPHPMRWFNMRMEKVVIMGKEFWDILGGEGTYEELLVIFRKVGIITKERIRKEYLGLD